MKLRLKLLKKLTDEISMRRAMQILLASFSGNTFYFCAQFTPAIF